MENQELQQSINLLTAQVAAMKVLEVGLAGLPRCHADVALTSSCGL